MWFCYEKSINGWSPVVYHQIKPTESVNRQSILEVPESCLDNNNEPNFGRLTELFPKPKPVTYNEPPIVLTDKSNG